MSIVSWQPLQELVTLRHKMDRLFDDLRQRDRLIALLPDRDGATWAPAVELKEMDADIVLKVQVPGIDAKDLDVQVAQDSVSIAGEYREEATAEVKDVFRSEFRYGQFHRIVPLPVTILHDRVTAEYKDGVLILTMPKSEEDKRKVVKVNIQQEARMAATEQRQHEEQIQEKVLSRAETEIGVH